MLSFDGTMLGISDQSAGDGQSIVYTAAGRRRDAEADHAARRRPTCTAGRRTAKFLVYTGGRNGEFDIYRSPRTAAATEIEPHDATGARRRARVHARTGGYIYFNSTRSGTMQIWRMKPDGTDPEQVTNDEFNNWFPHISPDGKWIAFISFPQGRDARRTTRSTSGFTSA